MDKAKEDLVFGTSSCNLKVSNLTDFSLSVRSVEEYFGGVTPKECVISPEEAGVFQFSSNFASKIWVGICFDVNKNENKKVAVGQVTIVVEGPATSLYENKIGIGNSREEAINALNSKGDYDINIGDGNIISCRYSIDNNSNPSPLVVFTSKKKNLIKN